MKATQLKNIIRESIKELITEQSNSNITVSPGDVVAVAAAYPIITNPQDLPMNTTPNANPFTYIYANQPFPGNVYLPPGPSNYSSVTTCGAARSYGINTQAEADAFNSVMNGENGVYLELVTGGTSAYQATQNVMAQLDADFQGPPYGCTYVGSGGVGSGGINVSGAGTPNLVNKDSTPPAAFAPNKVAGPQLDPSTLPDTSARGVTNNRMQKLANIKPNRK